MFLENVAHPSHLLRAYDGEVIERGQFLRRLSFLADGVLDRNLSDDLVYDATFAASDVPVYELAVMAVWARTDLRMTITLLNAKGEVVARDERVVGSRGTNVFREWPEGISASQVSLELEAVGPAPTRVILHDLRVQGQTPELAAYVHRLPLIR